jgi:hypothetical protein
MLRKFVYSRLISYQVVQDKAVRVHLRHQTYLHSINIVSHLTTNHFHIILTPTLLIVILYILQQSLRISDHASIHKQLSHYHHEFTAKAGLFVDLLRKYRFHRKYNLHILLYALSLCKGVQGLDRSIRSQRCSA